MTGTGAGRWDGGEHRAFPLGGTVPGIILASA